MARHAFGSLEFVRLVMTTTPPGVDPTADPVWVAFMVGAAEPETADLHVAEWAPDADPPVARIMRGPGALELDRAVYRAWVKIADNPETPLFPAAGVVQIY